MTTGGAPRRPTGAMTLFEHWVVDCSLKHKAAVKAARGLGATPTHTPAEAELTRLNVALFEKLHSLATLVREYGVDEVFGPRAQPLTDEQRRPAQT